MAGVCGCEPFFSLARTCLVIRRCDRGQCGRIFRVARWFLRSSSSKAQLPLISERNMTFPEELALHGHRYHFSNPEGSAEKLKRFCTIKGASIGQLRTMGLKGSVDRTRAFAAVTMTPPEMEMVMLRERVTRVNSMTSSSVTGCFTHCMRYPTQLN